MKLYRITKSYSYENGEYGGPVGAMVSSVLRNRERYSGRNWTPERKAKTA